MSKQAADSLSHSPVGQYQVFGSQNRVMHIEVEDSGTTMDKVQASQRVVDTDRLS